MNTTTFAGLGLSQPLIEVLSRNGVTEPFPIQSAAIPDALAGRDISGKAPTGSGKTLAFGLPLLTRVERGNRNRPSALILAPTRELAEQISVALAPLAKAVGRSVAAMYGGVAYGPQRASLRRGVDVLVATPGRLEDFIAQGAIDLSQASIVVIDEADRMADMGFLPAVRRILDLTSPKRQTLLFSATLDGDIAVLTRHYQTNPVVHEAVSTVEDAGKASHSFVMVNHEDRVDHTVRLVEQAGRSIVFTRTRRGADRLAKQMNGQGVEAVAIHGGLSQNQRTRALKAFSQGRAPALIATDVAARGIHIDDVATVIHFDIPADSKDYLHRSGRTARAGAAGSVVSLVTRDQKRLVTRIQRELNISETVGQPTSSQAFAPRVRQPQVAQRPQPERPAGGTSNTVFVNNLPWDATEHDLRQLFSTHGEVVDTTIITDGRGRSKGFGFVEMNEVSARRAISELDGSKMDGRALKVRAARPRASV